MGSIVHIGMQVVCGFLALHVAAGALAYEYPLSEQSIRDAYFRGKRNDSSLRSFLDKYVRRLSVPKSGPHISEVEVRTPYTLAIYRSMQTLNDSAQQAQADYRKTEPRVLVFVRIYLTPTYPAHTPVVPPIYPVDIDRGPVRLRAEDFWQEFRVQVFQEKELKPLSVRGFPIYGAGETAQLVGAEMRLEFDAADVASAGLRIEITAPTQQRTAAVLDLARLR